MKRVSALLGLLWPLLSFAEASGELEITPLAENVYLHVSYKDLPGYGWFPSNGLIVINGDRAVLVDTAWPEDDTPKLHAWLTERGYRLEAVLATHSHDDRTSGFAYLNAAGVPTYASRMSNELLAKRGEAQAVHVIEDGLPDDIARSIELFYPGPGHAQDNHVAWLPEHGILFGGCLVRSAGTSGLGNVADANLQQWASSVSRLLEKYPHAKLVVPGHGKPGDISLLQHTRELAGTHGTSGK